MPLEFDNNLPIYIQLVEKIKTYIISGKAKVGERLPSVREFALMMKVNPNTMQKALVELEETGLIYTERTNGKFVTQDTTLVAKFKREYALKLAEKYVEDMKNIGVDGVEMLEYIKETGGIQ